MIDINNLEELDPEESLEVEETDDSPIEELLENDDGSVDIQFEDVLNQQPQQFTDNLAEVLSKDFLDELVRDLLLNIEQDLKARERRDKQYEEGIRRTGLGDDAPGGATFSGASKVVHPVLAESCIDFAARAIKELFPANGPVRTETTGVVSPEEELQIKNLSRCLNDQFTKKIPEYRRIYEQELTQLPLGGSQFTKFYPDPKKHRICAEFVPIDDIIVPFFADSFYSAERKTHRQFLSQSKIDERIKSGQYRDVQTIKSIIDPERSVSSIATDKVEGKESLGFNEDGVRPIYEVYVELEIEEDEFSGSEKAPYIVTIDPQDEDVFSIYRNWNEGDQTFTENEWIVEDVFIPWRGAYGIGLPHLIGSLSGAATGALRALLDSAHINNAPTLLKLKNSRISGQTKSVDVTQVVEIEGPTGTDDIKKYLMPMPFNPPSSVLFQLLGWLTDAAKGVVSTASEKIADATSNTPVGTTQALIEQGAIIFSSIHSRLHYSQAKKFEIVLRILKQYFPEILQEYGLSPETVSGKNAHPVSDPNIFSEAQRMAQLQSMLKLAESAPQLYNQPELHRNALSMLKVNNFERFLAPPPPQPQPMNPASELIAFLQNIPVAVVEQEDHISHIIIHTNYLKDPMMGMNPIMVPVTIKVLDHMREHLTYFFAARMKQSVIIQQQEFQQQQMIFGQQQQQLEMMVETGQLDPRTINPAQLPQPPQQSAPEAVMAQASNQIVAEDTQFAMQAMEVINQVDAFVKKHMQQQDPNIVVAMAEIERKRANDEQVNELAKAREENLRKLESVDKLQKEKQDQFDRMMEQTNAEHQRNYDLLVQKVELMKNDADNRQHQITELLKNHDDNRTTIMVEKLKAELSTMIEEKSESFKTDDSYISELQNLIQATKEAQSDEKLALIMKGLESTIKTVKAPRKTRPIRDEKGEMIGAISEVEEE